MSEAVPTVEIVNPDNPDEKLILNQADYNPEEHTLWEDKDKPMAQGRPQEAAAPPKAPSSAAAPDKSPGEKEPAAAPAKK
jgi:hypothetical protein